MYLTQKWDLVLLNDQGCDKVNIKQGIILIRFSVFVLYALHSEVKEKTFITFY